MKIITQKLFTVAFFWLLFAVCCRAEAQQPTKIPRIGYLTGSSAPTVTTPDLNADAFRQGLRDLGYIEGKNIQIEYRYADGRVDPIPGLVAELMRLKVDVFVSPTLPGITAAKQASRTVPIVMVLNQDPVATGLIESLARPGGNITGLTRLTRELTGKRLDLFKEVIPTTARLGILFDADSTSARNAFEDYAAAARTLDMSVQSVEVRSSDPDFEKAFQAAAKGRINGIVLPRNSLLIVNRNRIAQLAIQNRMSTMAEGSQFADSGSLLSYASSVDVFRRAATYVDKILKGSKPADLPIEQPIKFELVINLKTAKQIGLTIPPNVLARADRVIK